MSLDLTPGHVLVVDDIDINRLLARAYLEQMGWTVHECASGAEALAFIAVQAPACVLLDIRMPSLDGLQVAATVRRTWPRGTMRLVAYTAHAITEEVDHIRCAGFDDVLIKPVTSEDMVRVIGRP